jgi:hypothetical protein
VRKPINVLYYPDFTLDPATLKRAILLFDELHIMDRPSFSFGGRGRSNFGMVGAPSPLRQLEQNFREEGMPLYVHGAPGGRMVEEDYVEVRADVNDPEFLRRFQQGLRDSPAFRRLIVPPGNYGPVGNQDNVVNAHLQVHLSTAFADHSSAITLSEDPQIQQFRHSTPHERAKALVNDALTCASKLNLALSIAAKHDHQPLADASPFGNLLGAKYARAIAAAKWVTPKIPLADISFAILDELIPPERLAQMSFREVIEFRKSSTAAREHFLEHVAALQVKVGEMPDDGDYQAEIEKISTTEIVPAARDFRNKVAGINEGFVAHLATGFVTFLGGSSAIQLFAGVSLPALLALAAAGAVVVGKGAIEAAEKERAVLRESSLSSILSLD